MKSSVTQIVILGIFILCLVGGVIVFSTFGTKDSGEVSAVQVSIWGTVPEQYIAETVSAINGQKSGTVNIFYTEVDPAKFEQALIEALADGTGPDAVIMPNTMLYKNQKKFSVISYNIISGRDFKDTYIEGTESLLTSDGMYGLPIFVDPMVMYWNRDMLTAKSVARPPQTWEEILALTDKLTERREDKSIIKSAVALGDYANVRYAKEILATLTIQSGGYLVSRDANNVVSNFILDDRGFEVTPFTNSLKFFTEFSDPLKSTYSWNRSLPDSEASFLNGDLAFYFAPASQAANIRAKNPNLNFDIAPMPQPKGAATKKTIGTVYSFSILATSQYKQDALANIELLTSAGAAKFISSVAGLPPARRDLLAEFPGTTFGDVFWQSALWTKTWLDPNPQATNQIFKNGVDAIVTGKSKPEEVTNLVSKQVDELLK